MKKKVMLIVLSSLGLMWFIAGSFTVVWNNSYSAMISFVSIACFSLIGGCNAKTVNSPKEKTNKENWIKQFRSMSRADKINRIVSIVFMPYLFNMISINTQVLINIHPSGLLAHFVVIVVTIILVMLLPFLIGLAVRRYFSFFADMVVYT